MTILGKDIASGRLISVDDDARSRGIYVIGSTGIGKTTLLQSIAYQDMKAGHGLCVLDPHGDMIDWLLSRVPDERVGDVILFDPADTDFPLGINLLECNREDPKQVRRVVDHFVSALNRMFDYTWGPRLEHVLSHTLWTAMNIPDSTVLEVLLLLTDVSYRVAHTQNLTDKLLVNFWAEFQATPKKQQFEVIGSTVNKLTPFLLDWQMRNIVGQAKSTINMRAVMEGKKILLVNLAKGDLGENNSALLGSFLINIILIAAMDRRDMPLEARKRKPFHVIVDEYQNFASESFSTLQSEARKYAVDLVVAHQFRDQLTDETRGSALNVGNFVSFRTTGADGIELSSQFDNTPPEPRTIWESIRIPSEEWEGYFQRGTVDQEVPGPPRMYSDMMMQTANELANMYPYRAKAKIIEPDQALGRPRLNEYVIDTLNPEEQEFAESYYGLPNLDKVEAIRKQTRQNYAKPKNMVSEEIRVRTKSAEDSDTESIDHEKLPPKS